MSKTNIIDQLGGIAAVSQRTGASRSAVSNWKFRQIPWRYRHILAKMAAETGVPLPADYWKTKEEV